mgnify:CR=1 FL=1
MLGSVKPRTISVKVSAPNTPSASTSTSTSPVAIAMPRFSAAPFPAFSCRTALSCGSSSASRLANAKVPSLEPSSTQITSKSG